MDIESLPSRKRVADVQTEDLEDNEHMDANECTSPFPQAEEESSDGRTFIGNWEHDVKVSCRCEKITSKKFRK